MGLIQRTIEKEGIPTVSLTLLRGATLRVRPPRVFFLRFPFGSPFGLPGDQEMQRHVILDVLAGLNSIIEPGTLVELPHVWPDKEGLAAQSPLR